LRWTSSEPQRTVRARVDDDAGACTGREGTTMTPAPDVRSWTCRRWRVRHTSRRADDSVYAGRHASCARSEPGRAPRRWSLRQTSGAGRADGGVCATRPGEQTTAHALAVTRASHGPSPDVHHDAGACARRQELDVQTVAHAPHVQASRRQRLRWTPQLCPAETDQDCSLHLLFALLCCYIFQTSLPNTLSACF